MTVVPHRTQSCSVDKSFIFVRNTFKLSSTCSGHPFSCTKPLDFVLSLWMTCFFNVSNLTKFMAFSIPKMAFICIVILSFAPVTVPVSLKLHLTATAVSSPFLSTDVHLCRPSMLSVVLNALAKVRSFSERSLLWQASFHIPLTNQSCSDASRFAPNLELAAHVASTLLHTVQPVRQLFDYTG